MTTDNVTKVVDTLDSSITTLTPMLNTIMQQLDNTVQAAVGAGMKYAPDVINLGLTVVRIDCLEDVVDAMASLLGLYILYRFVKWCGKLAKDDRGGNPLPIFGLIFGCVGAICAAGNAFFSLINVWMYVGLFEPKLYIAHLLVEKALNAPHK